MIYFALGLILLLIALRDVFQTVIVPRGKKTGYLIGPPFVRNVMWPPFRTIASACLSPMWQAELLGLFGPFVVIVLLAVWMFIVTGAFGLMAFSMASQFSPPLNSLATAFYVAGSSVLTIGAGEFATHSFKVRMLLLCSAFIGMVITASVVSFLFTLIASLQRREVLVSLLSNTAGAPPSGISIINTFSKPGHQKSIDAFYEECHHWCADVYETHTAYGILPYFRSNDPYTSWLTALGAILDSAALVMSVNPRMESVNAILTYQLGCKLIAEHIHHFNPTPKSLPDLSDDDFSPLYKRLKTAGFTALEENEARMNFVKLRQEYGPAHQALCNYFLVAQTPQSSDYELRLPAVLHTK